MPIQVSWDDEDKTITRLWVEGEFSIKELFDAWDEEHALMMTVDHPVYALNVFHNVRLPIRNFNINATRARVEKNHLPKIQLVVQVAENSFVYRILNIVASFMSGEVHVVRTLDEAYKIIQAHKIQHQG